jgi:hypothetical protein
MHTEELKKEQRILSQMRKTLGSVVKDVTPLGGSNPLSASTIQDVKDSFALISDREKELAIRLGFDTARPHYADEDRPVSNAVSFVKLSKVKK